MLKSCCDNEFTDGETLAYFGGNCPLLGCRYVSFVRLFLLFCYTKTIFVYQKNVLFFSPLALLVLSSPFRSVR